MNRNGLLCLLVAGLCAMSIGAEGHEDLERDMKAMNKPYKALLKQIKDKNKNADSLKLLIDLQAATMKAKVGEPEHLPAGQKKDEALKDFRSMMATCLISELECERALLDGDNEAAEKKLNDVTATMDAGHKEYRPKEHH
jgi:soluble cytochrome b562